MAHNKLNDGKTEFLIIGSRQLLAKVNIESIQVSEIKPVMFVRNAHIGKVCSKAFFGLYKIRQIRKFLSRDQCVHAFVTSHLDYCNSLLYGVSQYQMDRLQRVLLPALPAFYHGIPTSHRCCSTSTGFLLPFE